MKLKIVGSGCPTCQALFETVKKIVEEEKIDAEVEYSKDINELIEAGATGSPGLFLNGQLVHIGTIDKEELLEIIGQA